MIEHLQVCFAPDSHDRDSDQHDGADE